jgi:hypothetical protein
LSSSRIRAAICSAWLPSRICLLTDTGGSPGWFRFAA